MTAADIEDLKVIATSRGLNFEVYKELAALLDPMTLNATGYVPRDPEKDTSLNVIREALRADPERARKLLWQLVRNDLVTVAATCRISVR